MRTPTGPALALDVDGRSVAAYPGETLAVALMAAGVTAFRRSRSGRPRGPACNMGVCFECAVTVDGRPGTRACLTTVRDGMRVTTG